MVTGQSVGYLMAQQALIDMLIKELRRPASEGPRPPGYYRQQAREITDDYTRRIAEKPMEASERIETLQGFHMAIDQFLSDIGDTL